MQYLGSKKRIARRLLPELLACRKPGQTWVEPFVGGGNMIDKVDNPRLGADINPYIIALLIAVRDGWSPPENINQLQYNHIRRNKSEYPDHLVGFVGFACLFGGKFFNGYAKNNCGRNYAAVARDTLLMQASKLQGVDLRVSSYNDLDIPPNSLVYCDPPYAGTTRYAHVIDHVDLWRWCRKQSLAGHTVFVSEYSAPADFKRVISLDVGSNLDKNKTQQKNRNAV